MSDKQDNEVQYSETDCTMKMAFNAEDIELTQKIDVDYDSITNDSTQKINLLSSTKTKTVKTSGSLTGKSIFSRKRITDDFVKSSTILSTISAIPPLEKDLELHSVHENYDLKQQFSEGAQGIIRTAFDKALKRDIVIKSLKSDEIEERAREDENLFVSEARIMAQLDHPSIIPLYGLHCGTENKLHLAMKHIHGKTLQKYLQDIVSLYEREGIEKFDEKRSIITRLEYLIKVCEAVDYAHCKGVIHRDIKPENIMIGNYGEVYVMDWGLACLIDPEKFSDDDHLTEVGNHSKNQLVGTPCYIAPELIRGGECSPQSDIFSLGMILFEIVALEKAVPGDTVNDVLKNIVNWNYRPFKHRFLRGKLPEDIKAIIAKAICEPPSQRYKTAKDMAADLKLYLMREETAARPDNTFRRYMRAMINHKMLTSIVILSVLLGLAGSTAYSFYTQNALMRQQEEREAMLTHLQHGVAQRASEMEKIFFYFKTQLSNVAYRAGSILSGKSGEDAKIYSWKDFKKIATAPPDYVYSPAYGTAISLDYGVFKPGPGVKATDQVSKKIIALRTMFKHIMFTSDSKFENQTKNDIKKIIIDKGAPLSWIFIGLKSGSMLSYPGKVYSENYDPRERPWYKKALKQKYGMSWSEPYRCIVTSKVLISCTQCVYDKSDVFQGVAGLDISLNYIQKHLFSNQTTPGSKEYLLDKNGKIILSSDFKDKQVKAGWGNDVLRLKDFAFLKQFKRAIRRRWVQFEGTKFNRKYIFALNYIPSLGYYYVEQVSELELIKAYKNR
jgi:serine/threonine-protein kinase